MSNKLRPSRPIFIGADFASGRDTLRRAYMENGRAVSFTRHTVLSAADIERMRTESQGMTPWQKDYLENKGPVEIPRRHDFRNEYYHQPWRDEREVRR